MNNEFVNSYEFGKTSDGQPVYAYILENNNGLKAEFISLGCILRQLWVPKSDGSYVNIVHGLDSVKDYEEDKCYFGAFVGRFANRIKDSKFELNGQTICLEPNDGPNHLHGPWTRKVFDARPLPAATLEESSKGIIFSYRSPDMEDGFPGNVDVTVTYKLDDNDILTMEYEAVSDKDTVMNFTNHSYFNLGAGQKLRVNADEFLEVGSDIIPTGNILQVSDHPVMDLRKEKDVEQEYPELGYFDHCYILKHEQNIPDAVLTAHERGICMEVSTSEPAVQIYSGNPVGVAIETQMYPCAPNYPQFPSALVRAGQIRKWHTQFRLIY